LEDDHYGLDFARIALLVDVLVCNIPRSTHHLKLLIGVFETKVTGYWEPCIAQMSDLRRTFLANF
jgi:hypothetical protein